jgi:hypothetical protein
MLNRRALFVFCALALLLGLVVVQYGRVSIFYLRQELTDGRVAEAQGDGAVEQTFRSYYPGLSEVAVRLANPAPPDDQTVVLRLRAASAGAPDRLVVGGLLGELLQGDWLRFRFPALDDTAGETYMLRIETQGNVPLRLQAHGRNMYPEGAMPGGGDLVFQVRYSGGLMETASAFLARVIERKPGPFRQAWLYVLLLSGYVIAAAAAVVASMRARGPDKPSGGDPSPDTAERPGAIPC